MEVAGQEGVQGGAQEGGGGALPVALVEEAAIGEADEGTAAEVATVAAAEVDSAEEPVAPTTAEVVDGEGTAVVGEVEAARHSRAIANVNSSTR